MATAGSLAVIARMRPSIRTPALAGSLAASRRPQARYISRTYLAKVAVTEQEFAEEAKRIQNGEKQHIWDILKERGFVKDQTGDDDKFRQIMLEKRIGAYVGVDPTASSLHVGHLLPFMALFWLYIHGYGATTLVGGATAKVGDPIGRLQSRDLMSKADISMNITKIHYQLKMLWTNLDTHAPTLGYEKKWGWRRALWNNSQWYSSVPFSEVVFKLFAGMRLGPMLTRDTVKRRLDEGQGMSLSEFIYPMMQAWDWWHLFSSPKQTQMQIGGSDQYGNIIAGIEAINHIRTIEPHKTEIPKTLLNTPLGFTVPLLTDSSGAKFGKSSGNAVWLDPFLTSPFDLYGYFMRRPDADVENLLKLLTFLPMSQIKEIMAIQNEDPSKRHAHHMLAHQVLCLVHGTREADNTKRAHQARFAKPDGVFTVPEVESYPADGSAHQEIAQRFRTDIQLPRSLIMGQSIARILHAAGLAESISEAHRLCTAHGAYIAGASGEKPSDTSALRHEHLTFTPVKVWSFKETTRYLIDDKILILRRGKHFIRVVEMVSDEEWSLSGKSYPGEPGTGAVRQVRDKLKVLTGSTNPRFYPAEVANLANRIDNMKQRQKLAQNKGKPELLMPARRYQDSRGTNSKMASKQARSPADSRAGGRTGHSSSFLEKHARKDRIAEELLRQERERSSGPSR
ncbi:tyrosyl-tRNA synthetase [Microdochium nivale]|nr:tyrosyl-tRNA synthetase [Microdochium nivale]